MSWLHLEGLNIILSRVPEEQALSLYFPTAMLQSASIYWRGALHMAGAWFLCLVPWFLQLLPRGHPLIPWLRWSVGFEFWGPWNCGNWRGSFGSDCHPQHTTQTEDRGTPPSISVKEISLLVLELRPEGQASGLACI